MLYVKTMNLTTCKESIFASSLTVVQLSSVPMDTGTCTSNLKFSKFCYSLPYLRAKIRAMNYVQTIHPVSTVSAQSLFQNVTFLQSENAVLMNTLNLQWLRKLSVSVLLISEIHTNGEQEGVSITEYHCVRVSALYS